MFDLSHFFCFPLSLICFSYPLSFEYWLRVFFLVGLFAVWPIYMLFFSLIFEICFHHHAAYKKLTLANLLSFFLLHLVVCFAVCFVCFSTTKLNIFHIVLLFCCISLCFAHLNVTFYSYYWFALMRGISNKTTFYHFFKWYFSAFAGRMFSFRLVCSLAIYD